MFARDEGGIVVGDDGGGVFGQVIERVIGRRTRFAQIEHVADAGLFAAGGGIGNSFQDEGVQAIVGVLIGAGETFIKQHRKVMTVGEFGGKQEGVV